MHKFNFYPLFLLLICGAATAAPVRQDIEQDINKLISKMSLEEKIGQTAQRDLNGDGKIPDAVKKAVRAGKIGSFLNIVDRDKADELQRIAVEESPSKVPLIFARDVIHGFKTIFPIPLGQAASWNPDIVERGARIAAEEATTTGVRWTFAPMMDISRDPRWGRIAESFGEDPYLSSVYTRAMVRGFQGDDLSHPTSMAACAKHFVGYGAGEGGRDYNSAYLPEELLRNIYLPPFKAAVDAGAATFMSAFNEVNSVPATGNRFLMTQVLRKEWGFDGFVVSDYYSIDEMVVHGYARDLRHAAELAMNAGLDMEMVGTSYDKNLAELIQQGKVSMAQLDEAVRRILRVKYRLGLFEKPYVDRSRKNVILNPAALVAAKQAAADSTVLLKNRNGILPLAEKTKVAVIGPLADAPHEQMGTWVFDGQKKDSVTPLTALRSALGAGNVTYAKGLDISRSKSRAGFAAALTAARQADVVLFFGGEESILSGEAHSRADISLPGVQAELLEELHKTGTPIVLILMAGRPITLGPVLDQVQALLMAWHPGTMGGPALADILFGKISPSGRLPVTWPKAVGQIPIYYNHKHTGRPPIESQFTYMDDMPVEAPQHSTGNTSHYIDIGFKPEFPFGFGLTYTTFEYSNIRVSPAKIKSGGTLEVRAIVRNTGSRSATEVAQLYVRDVVGDVTRPVQELKGFERVTLKPGESRIVKFQLRTDDLAFYNRNMQLVTEPGLFNVWIGPHAGAGLQTSFELQ
jgi:beta-glucosidase